MSYRRKFIRTGWLAPWVALVIGLAWVGLEAWWGVVLIAALLTTLWLAQMVYTYRRWQVLEAPQRNA